MTAWITSDWHVGHSNLRKYCPATRGHFTTVEEMDAALIAEWKAKVLPGDSIIHLGDFSFHKTNRTIEILSQLPGGKYFIKGNHDSVLADALKKMGSPWPLEHYRELKHAGAHVVLFHFPIFSWHKQHHGSVHHHGHCHGSINHLNTDLRRVDVGWDAQGGKIITLDDAVAQAMAQPIRIVDHHEARE